LILAGAGGHALEVLDILIATGLSGNLNVFDQNKDIQVFQGNHPVIHTEEDLKAAFAADPRFVLGVGKPDIRQRLHGQMIRLGGKLLPLCGLGNIISGFADCGSADIFNQCFIGPNTRIGRGCLINTGVQIHHEVSIGEFTEVNPGAVVLGTAQIGSFCSIGANATVLPGIKIGNHVTVGAGAVIIRDIPDGMTIVGVPGRVVSKQ